jgi:BASS family bile acid:Na+ symporter
MPMTEDLGLLARLHHLVHRRFIWCLLGSYVLAAAFPGPGAWLRNQSLGRIVVCGWRTEVSLPMAMLAFLLLNAGLSMRTGQLWSLARSPLALAAGVLGNLLVPIAFVLAISQVLRPWSDPDEAQDVLVGLALVVSMPVAGSSAAWSQKADGDLALSLGLVLATTLLSPVTTPFALHAVAWMAGGGHGDRLHALATCGTGEFLAASVLVPALLGLAVRGAAGAPGLASAKPVLKLLGSVDLLLLNYVNASLSLPGVVADPDWDFLVMTLAIVAGLCVLAFTAGWMIARLLGADSPQRTSLTFGLGMNNNGTGLVLAATALADRPQVLLPVILYNLVQHVVAGCVDVMLGSGRPAGTVPGRRTHEKDEG